MVKISELRSRTVINVADGRSLGYIKDIELDLDAGRIKSLILPGKIGFYRFCEEMKTLLLSGSTFLKLGWM